MSNREEKVHEMVKEYYSEITNKRGGELASSVCSCASHCVPDQIKAIASELLMRLSQDTMDVVRRFQIRLRDALYLISVVVLAEMSM